MQKIEELIEQGKATIIDVRTPGEFSDSHVKGSINIPLQEIPTRLKEFQALENIVLCCASGGRSAQATTYLKQHGIDCHNAGSWLNLMN